MDRLSKAKLACLTEIIGVAIRVFGATHNIKLLFESTSTIIITIHDNTCDEHSSVSSTTAVQIYELLCIYILQYNHVPFTVWWNVAVFLVLRFLVDLLG